jgi:cysteine desulfurase family protein
MSDLIYFDNAATTMLKPAGVAEAVVSSITQFGGVGRGVHPAALRASMAVYQARSAVADLLGAPSVQSVAFAQNATHALNVAISGLLEPGCVALTTAASHNSVLRPLFKARDEHACEVRIVPILPDGSVDEQAFYDMLPGCSVVALTHASNLTGTVYDVARMAAAAHEVGAKVIIDAAQTAGSVPLDFAKIGADVLCFTGHKGLLGPQGTGGLIVAPDIELPPFMEGGSGTHSYDERQPRFMPEALEAGTQNAHGLAGLTAGVEWLAAQGVEAIYAHEQALRQRFVQGVKQIDGVKILGEGAEASALTDAAHPTCATCAIATESVDSSTLAEELVERGGICTRAGAHCAPLMHKALGTNQSGAVRFSFGPFNTADEVDTALHHLRRIIE